VENKPWPAPAKLNRFLHVTGRRPDGYHQLQTVFQFLDYSDFLTFRLREDGIIRRQTALPGVPADQDLAVRAARLLQQAAALPNRGVDIMIEKRLPMGGGLGGGSSDAATALVALNYLWNAGFSSEDLARLGLRLGADVPLFVHGYAAWAEGVGEHLVPMDLDEPWFVVLDPSVHISTRRVFADPELTRNTQPITISDFLSGHGGNDCEAVVTKRYPQVREALDWLSQFGCARMTGTGACVFAGFPTEGDARAILTQLPTALCGFVARGLNRSPLLARLQAEQ
jgi:4-diphosphocytidyl-2-C-methyl-D-erythritol kinase